ncbi:MAG: phosphatase PAP2 family protein [Gammaproteobacteria bacterium]|nr:MAG: phosphatase PAP2 family protein [Gammaproteobacteria bacterium]UTW42833.1 phosphatase PAP2 family protein [bacterium SCSIO 12844]
MAKTPMPLKSSVIFLILLVIFYWFSYIYLDQTIAYYLNQQIAHTSKIYQFSQWLDNLFDPKHWAMLMILIFIYYAWLFIRNKPRTQQSRWLIIALSLFVALAIGAILKYTLARYRPEMLFNHNLYGFHFFSMKKVFNSTPSGHALANFAGLLSLAYLSRKSFFIILACIIATIICISRLIVNDHFLSDIVFGAYIGIFSFLWVKWFIINRYIK